MVKETKDVTYKRLSSVKSKNSKMELFLRGKLFSLGYRYRVHGKNLYGKPDIFFPKQKLAIFCDSNFWHGFEFHKHKGRLKTNKKYWEKKILRNIDRDKIVNKNLKDEGWQVLRFWEHQINNNIDRCIQIIRETLRNE
jgi:DNA mismatch endonuclease Vsr